MTWQGLTPVDHKWQKMAMYIRPYDLFNQLCSELHPPGYNVTDHAIEKTCFITQVKTVDMGS